MAKGLKNFVSNITMTATKCLQNNTNMITISSCAISLKADEIIFVSRQRYVSKSDTIQRLRFEHGANFYKFSSFEEAETVAQAVRLGKIHIPKECLVFGLCSLSNESSPEVVIA